MFALGPGEIVVICVAAFIILGPEKLPEAAKSMGQMMGKLNKEISTLKTGVIVDEEKKPDE